MEQFGDSKVETVKQMSNEISKLAEELQFNQRLLDKEKKKTKDNWLSNIMQGRQQSFY
jgi:hypothetical protein